MRKLIYFRRSGWLRVCQAYPAIVRNTVFLAGHQNFAQLIALHTSLIRYAWCFLAYTVSRIRLFLPCSRGCGRAQELADSEFAVLPNPARPRLVSSPQTRGSLYVPLPRLRVFLSADRRLQAWAWETSLSPQPWPRWSSCWRASACSFSPSDWRSSRSVSVLLIRSRGGSSRYREATPSTSTRCFAAGVILQFSVSQLASRLVCDR